MAPTIQNLFDRKLRYAGELLGQIADAGEREEWRRWHHRMSRIVATKFLLGELEQNIGILQRIIRRDLRDETRQVEIRALENRIALMDELMRSERRAIAAERRVEVLERQLALTAE
jgi:hypothetical protein